MDLLELNTQLKENVLTLENMYKELSDDYRRVIGTPSDVYLVLFTVNMMCKEQAKAQRGEESTQMKFDNVEKFSEYLGAMTDFTLDYLKKKYNICY